MKGRVFQAHRPKSFWISFLSMTTTLLLVSIVVFWHGTSKNTAPSNGTTSQQQQQQQQQQQRLLSAYQDVFVTDGDFSSIDDDTTRMVTCKKYLQNFLNGTTDSNDVCQAFATAYREADCAHDTHVDILTHRHNASNGTVLDDDVVMDDYFENWECCERIQTLYEKNCESDRSELQSVRLLGIMLVLLVCTMIKAILKQLEIKWLPDSCAFILVGTIVGGILRLIDRQVVERKFSFDNDLFLQILLPPIIFQAALNIDKRAFRRDLFPILGFAGIGTAFSAIAIGLITHHVSSLGNGETLPLMDSLVFGSLISSIDPVATLSILSGVGVSQTDTLYILIFGESLLNDGVAIVLFDTLKSHLGEDAVLNQSTFYSMLKLFAGILFGSIGIGLACGMGCTLYFWLLRGKQTAVTEVAIFFCWALIPYYVADGLGCSGIIAIMVMGFFLDYFVIGGFQSEESSWMDYMAMRCEDENGQRVSQQQATTDRWSELQIALSHAFSGRGHILSRSRHHVGFVAHVIASLMETAIFAYLGLFLFNGNIYSFRLNITAIFGCVSSRAVMVILMSLLINICVYFDFENTIIRWCRACNQPSLNNSTNGYNSSNNNDDDEDEDDTARSNERVYVDGRTQVILLLAGVRGAVSFALVENIPVWDAVTKTGSKYKAQLKAMTSSSIFFTLFVFGALTYYTVNGGNRNRESAAGPLTRRLLSEPLDSDDENQSSYDMNNSESLEIQHPTHGRTVGFRFGNQIESPLRPQYEHPQHHDQHPQHHDQLLTQGSQVYE